MSITKKDVVEELYDMACLMNLKRAESNEIYEPSSNRWWMTTSYIIQKCYEAANRGYSHICVEGRITEKSCKSLESKGFTIYVWIEDTLGGWDQIFHTAVTFSPTINALKVRYAEDDDSYYGAMLCYPPESDFRRSQAFRSCLNIC